MKNKSQDSSTYLESAEVSKIVGIPPTLLNKFIERHNYEIRPSIRAGRGRGSRRIFAAKDVYGVALVWWLFEAGLRSELLDDVLKQIGKVSEANANDAAADLLSADIEMIAIRREPRLFTTSRRPQPEQEVFLTDWTTAVHLVENNPTASVLFIPIAERFKELDEKMQKIHPTKCGAKGT